MENEFIKIFDSLSIWKILSSSIIENAINDLEGDMAIIEAQEIIDEGL